MECAYKAPGLYREVRLDDKGQVKWVEITDHVAWTQTESILPRKKKATLAELAAVLERFMDRLHGSEKLNTPTCSGWKAKDREPGRPTSFGTRFDGTWPANAIGA